MALAMAVSFAAAFHAPGRVLDARLSHRAVAAVMFEEPEATETFEVPSAITRSRLANVGRTGSVAVTDGSGSFYGSRKIFNVLHDFGGYAKIFASTVDLTDARKMLTSRANRYSGLADALEFHDEKVGFASADSWLALSADVTALPAQIDAAVAAGVTRALIVVAAESSAPGELDSIEARLAASGMAWTLMRTGPLVDAAAGTRDGGGLKLGEIDMPVCEDASKEDVYRFAAEALTLSEAHGRAFSLCPSTNLSDKLREMRLCGYERREEVQLILKGTLTEEAALPTEAEPSAAEAEVVLRSEAEVAAEREEELKALLERARKRGEETQKRMAYEEAERAEKRKEAQQYYSSGKDDDGDAPADAPPAADEPPAKA